VEKNNKILPFPEIMQGISTSAESKEERSKKKKIIIIIIQRTFISNKTKPFNLTFISSKVESNFELYYD
jgi:hypothetical protein